MMRCGDYEIRERKGTRDLEVVRWTYAPDDPWCDCDLVTGQYSYRFEYCHTIGWLRWNMKENYYYATSCGMRWAKESIPQEVCDFICKIAADREEEYRKEW